MAALQGVNAAIAQDVNGAKKIPSGEHKGKERILFDEYTFLAEAANNDTLDIGGKLPAGARVVGAVVNSPDLGGTGTLNLGFSANGVDAADDDAFIAGADASGQAVLAQPGAGVAGIGKQFAADTQVQLKFVGATASATGKKIQSWIRYVLD
jgi:hypothetical protein